METAEGIELQNQNKLRMSKEKENFQVFGNIGSSSK